MPAALIAATATLVALIAQVWVVSAGTMTTWPIYGGYYSFLADAFRSRQTSLVFSPDPRMLRLADPYDPRQNEPYRLHDASLYNGEYYIYFGPMPALLVVAARFLPLQLPLVIGDQYLLFTFTAGITIFSVLLLLRIRKRLFPEQPGWMVGVGALTAGMAAPILYVLARASVYEAAITGGQCFLLAGFYFAFLSLEDKPRLVFSAAAGLAWATALACRASLVVAIAALIVFFIWRLKHQLRSRAAIHAALLLTPLILTGALLGAYNYARFGSVFESGLRYQLVTLNGFKMPPADVFASAHYVRPNFYRCLFEWMDWERSFPFVRASQRSGPWLYSAFDLPREFLVEPLVGIAWCLPFGWLAVVPFIVIWRRYRSRAPLATKVALDDRATLEIWLTLCLAAMTTLSITPALFVLTSTMRYLPEIATGLVPLATLGAWQLLRLASASVRWRGTATAGTLLAAFTSVILGLLLGVTGQYGHFEAANPGLYRWLTAHVTV